MANSIKRKPEWLRKKITPSINLELESIFKKTGIHTICQEAMCPNVSECFAYKQASFMIMGTRCTRACSFCAVDKGHPVELDKNEPKKVSNMIHQLGLKHVVITSPTRDDLSDAGAQHFCNVVEAIKSLDESIVVELLIPDMNADEEALRTIANSGALIIGHNLESVPRLYHIRGGSNYKRSLEVLKTLSSLNPNILTKSAIMLGLGESDEEVESLMRDLLEVDCKYLSVGQYLAPTIHHTSVMEYVKPERFDLLREMGMKMGFKHIKSSPYARSSYMAHEYLQGGV